MGTPGRERGHLDTAWRWLPWLLPAAVALVAPLGTLDLAYHLRLGAQMLSTRTIPSADTFTFSVEGRPWLDQQWGAQILLRMVDVAGGWSGLALLGAALIAAAIGSISLACGARGASTRAAAVLALVGFVVAAPTLAVRPQLFGVLAVAVALWAVTTRATHPARRWLLPAIALAVANLHGSFPIMVVIAALAAIEDLLRGDRRGLIVAIVTAAATLVNPWGPRVWSYVWEITSDPVIRTQVTEWAAPSLAEASGWLALASVVLVTVVGYRERARVRPMDLVWLAAFLVPAVASQRAVVWWALVAPVVVAGWVAEREVGDTAETGRGDARFARTVVATLAVLVILALPWWRGGPQLRDAPDGVADAIGALPSDTAVMAYQPWSSWIEHRAPAQPVYVDARIELFPADVWARYDDLLTDPIGVLEATGAQAVAGPASWAPVVAARDAAGWEIAYDGDDGVVVVRETLLGDGDADET
ncbi:MAG TPA: hypothetical protein VE032_01945 [Actinomycetota bacterium]|nr:hypothetical protein [Actinomycetota bacterium]